ncbi:response regulator transcription factor [Streptomyces sp. NPDC047315]|uniref:helix-turn-helix transcriptional regulator n=1 Tax=Streptomyces sp. NPDC047315 TaxID=3155142 RepID=UPI0033F9DCDE
MLEEANPGSRVVAVATADDAVAHRPGRCVTLLLSASSLSGDVSALRALMAGTCARLVLLAGALDREHLHLAAELPVDTVVREQDLSVETLAETLRALRQGMASLPRSTMRELLALAADPAGTGTVDRPLLSARELDTLRLMSAGMSNRQIANRMCITVHGVKRHVANILVKLGCQNRTMAVTLGLRLGLVDLDSASGD